MSNPGAPALGNRRLKAGEVLIKPGDKLKTLYLIQSGRISVCQTKGGRTVEIAQLSQGQPVGEDAAFGGPPAQLTALALRDTVVLEVPFDQVNDTIGRAPPAFKTFFKALGERLKASFAEIKASRINGDAVPCPGENVAKVFGVVYHASRIVGRVEKKSETLEECWADWTELKRFGSEVFSESVVRIEDAVAILIKLGYAELEEDDKKKKILHITNLRNLENFFDYYGSYFFKGGYDELLKTNSKLQKIAEEFLAVAADYPVDRMGQATLPYKPAIDAMKKRMGQSFEADQLFRLEQKGLFIKRTATQDGGTLSFFRADFEQMQVNWSFLREIELWNEKGFVEVGPGQATRTQKGAAAHVAEPAVDPVVERQKWAKVLENWQPAALAASAPLMLRSGDKAAAGEVWCSVCMSVLASGQKSCGVCGADQSAA